ncbi:hypothetical protein AAF712_001321 [Marasmius tenuissimus]|uniref:PhoD-like phosphatase domain-containing protein n=1 Tax=Marasmius tenuissimus TaxID=585030 RepID=A0ABR3ADN8_9AGAR
MPPSTPGPPALPPKDDNIHRQPGYGGGHGYGPQPSVSASELTKMSAVERSKTLRIAPADSGSVYESHPTLTYEWDPDKGFNTQSSSSVRSHQKGTSFDLGPHPADPHSTSVAISMAQNGRPALGPRHSKEQVSGKEIWVYGGAGGTFTFWRFMIRIPLESNEMPITYTINNGQQMQFYVPGRNQNMRWASHSCNGFSAGVNPEDFRGPGFQSGYDPCWMDLLSKHAEAPFHALIGGGDQLLTREPELQEWVSKTKPEDRKTYKLTDEIKEAIDRFYFSHYCKSFRSGAFARANSSM